MTEPVRILITGGTFDKEYNELSGELFFQHTHVPEMLRLGRCTVPYEIEVLMMVDSLHMDDAGRAAVIDGCRRAPEPHVVVTHGTDTMVRTAHALAQAGIADKTIVLTGAMVPYKFGSSDGLFNLGAALAFAQTLAPGVYVAMNGQYFLGARWRRIARWGDSSGPLRRRNVSSADSVRRAALQNPVGLLPGRMESTAELDSLAGR